MNLAPIVLFVYNRPYHTQQTLEALSKNALASKSILYVYADGPKDIADSETIRKIYETREVVKSKRWCREVILIESEKNKGLADSIVEGVTDIVNKHGKVIVLEDDLITSIGFLKYMNDALDFYQSEEKVMHVSGYMFPVKEALPETFFYNTASCWGWGTWKRAWKVFNNDPQGLLNRFTNQAQIDRFNIDNSYNFYDQLHLNAQGIIKTWAVKWYATIFFNKGFSLHPYPSLVNNIGHDQSGENCIASQKFDWPKLPNTVNVSKIVIKESKKARKLMVDFYGQQPKKSFRYRISNRVPTKWKTLGKKLFFKESSGVKNELDLLKKVPRFTEVKTSLFGKPIIVPDTASFISIFNEIFELEIYKFIANNETPFIIDAGANIGLSIIYFKNLYPNAQIVAFEPDTKIFKTLSENIKSFGYHNISLINKAVWNAETELSFFSEGADGGKISSEGGNSNIIVSTVRLRDYLHRPVDFLKMDIEGAETLVLDDCRDLLHNVEKLFVEYHSYLNMPQSLNHILAILTESGFRYSIHQHGVVSYNPFIEIRHQDKMDILLNISAYRVKTS